MTQPNRALQLYRDKDFPLDVSQSIYRYVGTGGEVYYICFDFGFLLFLFLTL